MSRLVAFVCLAACAGPSASTRVEAPVVIVDDEPEAAHRPRFEPSAFEVAVKGRGRPMILIPGLACPGSVWDEFVKQATGIETHTLTIAGFAGVPPFDRGGKPLFDAVVADLAAYIRDRGLEHPIVVGHSLGGTLALQLAIAEPELVGPVIVVDGRAVLGGDPDSIAVAKATRAGILTMSDPDFAANLRWSMSDMADNMQRLERVFVDAVKSDHKTTGDAIVELFSIDLRPKLANIRAPTLLVLPEDPQLAWSAKMQMQAIPKREIAYVPNAKHFIMLDNPDGYFHAVDAFLAAHP